jgi:hypothetical protein
MQQIEGAKDPALGGIGGQSYASTSDNILFARGDSNNAFQGNAY